MPFGNDGNSMFWQAEAGFYFRMSEGYLGHYIPAEFEGQQIIGELAGNKEVNLVNLAQYLKRYDVREIVIEEPYGLTTPFRTQLEKLGFPHVTVGGATILRVPQGSGAGQG